MRQSHGASRPCTTARKQVTSLITESWVALGLEVTLFATGDSVTTAELDSLCPVPYAENPALDGRVCERTA